MIGGLSGAHEFTQNMEHLRGLLLLLVGVVVSDLDTTAQQWWKTHTCTQFYTTPQLDRRPYTSTLVPAMKGPPGRPRPALARLQTPKPYFGKRCVIINYRSCVIQHCKSDINSLFPMCIPETGDAAPQTVIYIFICLLHATSTPDTEAGRYVIRGTFSYIPSSSS